jgi:hypothetical protein
MTNHYKEGVERVMAARRVVDLPGASLWQRYKQIGAERLPLQTVLIIPFASSDWMWRTGFAGSIISMLSFITATVALYLFSRKLYEIEEEPCDKNLPAISLAVFALNPSALFMQATPMPEMLKIAALVLAAYLLMLWAGDQTRKRLLTSAIAMALATLAAYEAWLVALFAIVTVALASEGEKQIRKKTIATFAAIVFAGPIFWLLHNWAVRGRAFNFLSEASESSEGVGWSKILAGNLLFDFFWMALAVAIIAGPFLLLLAASGFARLIIHKRRNLLELAPSFLLIVPFFFHVAGLFRGDIEIFPLAALPLVNVRYGLIHLPAIALFAPAAIMIFNGKARRAALMVGCAIIAAQYIYLISDGFSQLEVHQEGYRNRINSGATKQIEEFRAGVEPAHRLISE